VAAIWEMFPLFVFDGDIFHVYSLEQQKLKKNTQTSATSALS